MVESPLKTQPFEGQTSNTLGFGVYTTYINPNYTLLENIDDFNSVSMVASKTNFCLLDSVVPALRDGTQARN